MGKSDDLWGRQIARLPESDATRLQWVIASILEEHNAALDKFPTWPNDPFHALAVLGEEYGELVQAVLKATYEARTTDQRADAFEHVRAEAVQVGAMAIRFILALDADAYTFFKSLQHRTRDNG